MFALSEAAKFARWVVATRFPSKNSTSRHSPRRACVGNPLFHGPARRLTLGNTAGVRNCSLPTCLRGALRGCPTPASSEGFAHHSRRPPAVTNRRH